jgi:nucleotide-binding universal stress UspA family protein
MLKQILVGVNGSEYSRGAVEVAVQWALQHQASLTGLAVVDLPQLMAPQPTPLGAGTYKVDRDEIVLANARRAATEQLSEFSTRCAAAGINCRTLQFEGDPVKLLTEQSQQADLLVVGRKSQPPEFGVAATHVLRDVLHRTTRPVLCVPRVSEGGGAALVAYDGSPQAAKTLQAFQSLGLAAGREVHLLSVLRDPSDRIAAELAIEYLRLHGHTAHLHVDSSQASPASVILAESQRVGAGVIVMGAFGQPSLKEFFFGSVTKTVLAQSTLPMFLFH